MTAVTVTDPRLADIFDEAAPLVVVDEDDGAVLGYFAPAKPTTAHLRPSRPAVDAVAADPPLTAELTRARGPVVLCRPDGAVLGYFSPAKPTLAHLEPPHTDEEIDRMLSDPNATWYTAAEVEAKLRELRAGA